MTNKLFEIGAEGIDAGKIVADIRATVARKTEEGVYTDGRVARAERMNLDTLKDADEFLAFYLDCLRDAVFIDIGDFEIVERRARFSSLLVALKKVIWKLLKFYTYRLWSQQNLVNGLLLSAIENAENRNRTQLEELRQRVTELEEQLASRKS